MPDVETRKIDRRYQIFVSSTFRDLADRRKEAIQVIFERGHIPIALERFSAAEESDLRVIKRAISDCQIYLLIIGSRYGERVPGEEISFTELEYNIAQEHRLLTLVLQMHPDEINKRRKADLNPDVDRDRHEIDNSERFRLFLDRLKKHHRQFWVPGEDFKYDVLRALDDNLPGCGRRGWIPEPEDPTIIETADNEFIVDLVTELKGFDVLYRRVNLEADKKRALAQCFRQKYASRILKHKVSLFFESGSTVAYVAKALAGPLSKEVGITDGEPSIKLSTNNVLAFLLLWLKMRVPCSPFPWSAPSEKTYGAWYGGLEEKEWQNPDYTGAPLDAEARDEIRKLLDHPFRPNLAGGPALLLGAASGLQVGSELKLRFQDGLDSSTRAELADQVRSCRGPHVGSYHNKVFKRFMYATGIPIVLFIAANKVDCEIAVGKCHFILDREFTWEQFCTAHPVAFCVGCSQMERRKYHDLFAKLGFSIVDGNFAGEVSGFLARNRAFITQFEESTPVAAASVTGHGD